MKPKRRADSRPITGQDLQDPAGQAGLCGQFGQAQGGEAGLLRGLYDDRIARSQSGPDFPRHHEQWEVPGQNSGDDTNGFAQDHGDGILLRRGHLVINFIDQLRVPFQGFDGLGNVDGFAI